MRFQKNVLRNNPLSNAFFSEVRLTLLKNCTVLALQCSLQCKSVFCLSWHLTAPDSPLLTRQPAVFTTVPITPSTSCELFDSSVLYIVEGHSLVDLGDCTVRSTDITVRDVIGLPCINSTAGRATWDLCCAILYVCRTDILSWFKICLKRCTGKGR